MARRGCCRHASAFVGFLVAEPFAICLALHTSTESETDTADIEAEFSRFNREHNRDYRHGSEEYTRRLALFSQRFYDIQEHNSGEDGILWTQGVNRFTDQTDDELSHFLGWRHLGGLTRQSAGDSRTSSFVDLGEGEVIHPPTKSWQHLKMARRIMDQGHCGSCWAVATATTLEAHHEIFRSPRTFSVQELVSCTSNPLNCGGRGQCDGATVEIGMDWVMARGLQTAAAMPYTATAGTCDRSKKPPWRTSAEDVGPLDSDDKIARFVHRQDAMSADPTKNGRSIGLNGYRTLKMNDFSDLMSAIQQGPVAVSVAAGGWFSYKGGIFNCSPEKNSILNHAVVLFGYAHTPSYKYWLVRNSWGPAWGEHGFIRVLRRDQQAEQKFCGNDTKPKEGVSCDSPSPKPSVVVCGACGILYDSVVPHFAPLKKPSAWSLVENGQSTEEEDDEPDTDDDTEW
eukprot:TRINITY_DN50499_c0_g1_i1.p1 TRINITY_DN50499_c0_g1~~TRINITY_DN50499_c0_g1_i1.p1  ORF type:complete len:455 (+),score=48.29 TRINITY_DN50499_c0_g1_i1:102-1466(+)